MRFNTAIAAMMELTNHLTGLAVRPRGVLQTLVLLLSPFAPHIAEELWESFGHSESLSRSAWPAFSSEFAREEEIEVAVQVNGKLRSRIFTNASASDDELRDTALADEKIKSAIEGKDVVKVIVIPKRLVNLVVR